MEKVVIYKFQLEAIKEALRITANVNDSRKGKTCLDRQIRQAEKYAENALKGEIEKRVPYI